MDIYERLKQDHDKHRALAKQIMETSGDSQDRHDLWRKFKPEATAHAAAEEITFYAELMSHEEGQKKSRHSVSEHKTAADIIKELEETDMGSGGWIQKFEKLKKELEHHMREEENEVFKKAQSIISQSRAVELAGEFDRLKQEKLSS